MIYKVILAVTCVLALNGCLSQIAPVKESAQHWIGHNIKELEKASELPSYQPKDKWPFRTYQLANKNLIYVDLVRPNCYIHWEVNPQGIIVGYKTEGDRCY